MKRTLTLAVGLFAAFWLYSALQGIFYAPPPDRLIDGLQRERLARQIAMDARRDEQLDELRTFTAGFMTVLPIVAVLGIGALAARAITAFAFKPVKADENGLYPLLHAQLIETAPQAALAFHQAKQIAAGQQPTPQTVSTTYAPHVVYRPQNELPPPSAPSQVIQVPAFAQLLASGAIGQGQPLLLGYTETGALTGGWRDLCSSAVAGISGSGKTTTLRFLASQSAMHGARFLVLDPHADAGQESLAATLMPLSGAFLAQPATTDKQILDVVKLAQNRLQGRIKGTESDRTPIIVACDEFTSLMRSERLTDPLGGLLESISQEGRKVGVFALLSGQIWSADRSGGSKLRDSLASAYVHRIKRRQAGMLLGMGDRLPDTSDLPAGQAVLLRTSGELARVAVPLTTQQDVLAVGTMLQKAPASPFRAPSAPLPRVTVESPHAGANQAPASQQEGEILTLLAAGKTPSQVVRELFGVANGNAYASASREVAAVVSRLAQRTQE
jgi:hypothetical protein